MRRLVMILLCLAVFPAGVWASDLTLELPQEALDILQILNERLALVEERCDLGDGMMKSFTKRYAFAYDQGMLLVGERYSGESLDSQGPFMRFSGAYRYTIPPNVVEVELAPAAPFIFKIRCQGNSKCIQYENSDEMTWTRGIDEPKPRTTTGQAHLINIYVGENQELLDLAYKSLSRLLGILRQVR